MSYRDDRDADRARIESLELELAAAKARVAELEGRREQALVVASETAIARAPGGRSAAARWFGAPLELVLEKELAGSYPTERFEDLVERIRLHTRDTGRTELMRTSMTWSAAANPKGTGPFTVVTVSVRDGVTRLVVGERLGQLAGALYGGIGGGVGGGAIMVPIVIGMATMPILIPGLIAGWLGATYGGTRALFKRLARRRAEQMQQLFDVLVEELDRGIAGAGIAAVR